MGRKGWCKDGTYKNRMQNTSWDSTAGWLLEQTYQKNGETGEKHQKEPLYDNRNHMGAAGSIGSYFKSANYGFINGIISFVC